jgi:hypothetical protein
MDPAADSSEAARRTADQTAAPPTSPNTGSGDQWQPGIPPIREHLPSLIWGAALPIAVYFLVRNHVNTDARALIIAGGFSAAWIVVQFVRQRRVDIIGAIVLFGFAVGVVSSTLLGGNAYVLKVRDGFFTALFGIACVVTVFTHERPAFFYVSRYFSAGNDKEKVSAYNRLHEFPTGRHTFRVLSVVWGVGLVVEAGFRMTLAGALPTGTFLAVSPFITGTIIGGLFAFTVVYTKRAQLQAAAMFRTVPETVAGGSAEGMAAPAPTEPGVAEVDGLPQIPFP